MLNTQKLTAQVLIAFMERLIAKRKRKLMWIVDRHPVHRCDAVQQWLHEHHDSIDGDALLALLLPAVESS
jgi:hypothetical protein